MDFALVNVEGRHHIDVTRAITTDFCMHQPDDPVTAALRRIIVNSLDQGTCTVTYASYRYLDFSPVIHIDPRWSKTNVRILQKVRLQITSVTLQ